HYLALRSFPTRRSSDLDMLTEHLRNMAVFKDQLSEVHTDGVQPTTHGVEVKNVLRKDEPKQWITQEEVLKNAPDKQDGQFRVPSDRKSTRLNSSHVSIS